MMDRSKCGSSLCGVGHATSFTGLAHIHTRFSHDGELTLGQFVDLCRTKQYSFAFITEHAQDVSEKQLSQLVSECKSLSECDFIAIPGLEYECQDNIHLLAIGVEKFLPLNSSLTEMARSVRENGGLAIVAHPSRNGYYIPESAAANINGIEVWNSKLDGAFAPNVRSLSLLRRFRESNPDIFGYAGPDWHWEHQGMRVCLRVECPRLERLELLKALEKGRFLLLNGRTEIPVDGGISASSHLQYYILNYLHKGVSYFAKKVIYRMLKSVIGKTTSAQLKRSVRRYM